jgi:hypothetical protein
MKVVFSHSERNTIAAALHAFLAEDTHLAEYPLDDRDQMFDNIADIISKLNLDGPA